MNARFSLREVTGRGRHCTVWRACDAETREDVALKVGLHGALDVEWDVLSRARHPSVVRGIAQGRWDGGRDFLAMEFASRGVCRPAPQADHEVESALDAATAALQAIHAAGFVHRDVKPTHFLRRADGSWCLADLGNACRVGVRGPAATVIGTPRYAAPELTQGAPAAPAMDIYSLGATLHEWLTGKPVFQGETMIEQYSQHARARPPDLPAPLARWQALVHAILAKDASQRPSAGELAARMPSLSGELA